MEKKLVLHRKETKTVRARGNKSAKVVMKVVLKNGKKKVRTTFTDPNLKVKHGGRKIKYHDSFDEAKMWLTGWESEQWSGDYGISSVNTRLSLDQVKNAELAFDLLQNKHNLVDAVNFYLSHQTFKSMTLKEAFEKWNDVGVREKNLRPDTIRDRKSSMSRFVEKFGDKDLRWLDKETIKKFIYRPKIKQVTINGHVRVFKGFFKFCVKEEWIKHSPIENLEQGKLDQVVPEILTIPEARALIKSAKKLFDGNTLAYFTLLLFTGLRPSEIHDGTLNFPNRKGTRPLSWDDFDLNVEVPRLVVPRSKTRKMRGVELEPNCVSLLKMVQDKPLLPVKGFRRMFPQVYKDAGIARWKEDICRHSWATYFFVKDKKLGKDQLARMAGNSTSILEKAYLNRGVTKQDGLDYFNIGLGRVKSIRKAGMPRSGKGLARVGVVKAVAKPRAGSGLA